MAKRKCTCVLGAHRASVTEGMDRGKLHDFCRKGRYCAANRKLHWIRRLVECHSTFLGFSYRHFRQGKRDYPELPLRNMLIDFGQERRDLN